MHIPLPPKWDRAIDGLDMKDFTRRAQEFERSLLPRDIPFPRRGQVWQAIRDCEVSFMAWFSKGTFSAHWGSLPPVFPCGPARLTRGEQVRILPLEEAMPLTIDFLPLRYSELEAAIVPITLRQSPAYSNYQLSAPTARTVGLDAGRDYFLDCFVLAAGTANDS